MKRQLDTSRCGAPTMACRACNLELSRGSVRLMLAQITGADKRACGRVAVRLRSVRRGVDLEGMSDHVEKALLERRVGISKTPAKLTEPCDLPRGVHRERAPDRIESRHGLGKHLNEITQHLVLAHVWAEATVLQVEDQVLSDDEPTDRARHATICRRTQSLSERGCWFLRAEKWTANPASGPTPVAI